MEEEGVRINRSDLARLVTALKAESDGKALRRELIVGLRVAVQPAVALAKGAILSMGVTGTKRADPPLRVAVAAAIRVQVRLAGKRPGVRVVVRKSRMPRGFRNAPKRLNSAKGWRHQVFGNQENWVTQMGRPDWFDGSMRTAQPAAYEAVKQALANVARRIDAKSKG